MKTATSDVPRFNREFFGAESNFTRIGDGPLGGKATGLLQVRSDILSRLDPNEFPCIEVSVPTATVLTTELFDSFTRLDEAIKFVYATTFFTESKAYLASIGRAPGDERMAAINRGLVKDERRYLLIGFGRWGTSDPWLGIPVAWGQISGARVIVEATLPDVQPDLSQGSHFFHNLLSFHVLYLSVEHHGPHRIDWGWLGSQPVLQSTDHLTHVRLSEPLEIRVDGASGRGVVRRHG